MARFQEQAAHWQRRWLEKGAFLATEDCKKPKYYALDMFPYPSAAGLHVGHPLGYTATDIVARYYRMKGYNVLHPMGWDAFGLPAEQHAIDTGEHPALVTEGAIRNFKRQLMSLGFSYDWQREVATCDPKYYHWTQWIFRLLFEKGLAYQAQVAVNWCPALKTVLANEEVVDGKSERGGHDVYRVPMTQWMLKITAYAERLLADLDTLDWPESTKEIQRNWIGKSQGAKIAFPLEKSEHGQLDVFTTCPETIYGVTYMVLAPEHPLVNALTTKEQKSAVAFYQEEISKKSDLDRTDKNKNKTGVFLGAYALNPLTREPIPIWIADYVLMGYGTGAIMAVPAHDERDQEFAHRYNLPITTVIDEHGFLVRSQSLDGLKVPQAKQQAIALLEAQGCGQATTTYRLRDWVFSRQRYWGEPIPMLKDPAGKVLGPLAEADLPLTLPAVESYEPTDDGKSPLAAMTTWVQRVNQQGETVFVETNTMPGSAGSSWYFLRYVDPFNTTCLADYEKLKYWMPVDLYVGGQEHAVGHLLYARFWTKVLFDAGLCPVNEPFQRLVHQGVICRFGAKMSKSKGNGVNPDEVVEEYGADTLRVYEMFMGPLTQTKEWDDSSLAGIYRFLNRVERFYTNESGESLLTREPASLAEKRMLHKTIQKVSRDIEALSFNTAIAQMMIFMNHMTNQRCRSQEVLEPFLKLLAPFAPHLAEELWLKCVVTPGTDPEDPNYPFISLAVWPNFDVALVIDDEITLGVQVNGKLRGEITVSRTAPQEEAVDLALAQEPVRAAFGGKEPKKTVYVPGRILNFVV